MTAPWLLPPVGPSAAEARAVATRLGARRDPAAEAALGDPALVICRHFGLPEGT